MPLNEHGQRSLGVLGAGAGHLAIGTQIGGGQGQAKAAGPLGWGEYYCPGLPKWSGTGLLPAWDQKCPLMCAFGTKRRVLVHEKFPNRARFGL